MRAQGDEPETGWRSPAKVAANWAQCRKLWRTYVRIFAVLLMAAAWYVGHLLGYWEGYADARANRPPAPAQKESTQ